ncbi:Procathepsin L [Manis pentadactyla]|nr:Procathepsin L [Manis pentadactyla]
MLLASKCPNILELHTESVGFLSGSLQFIKGRTPRGEHLGCWIGCGLCGWMEKPLIMAHELLRSARDQGSRQPEFAAANDTGFVGVPWWEKALMKAMVTVSPISVAIDAGHESFQFYKAVGIRRVERLMLINTRKYEWSLCSSKDLDHSILLVGYGFEGTDSNNKFWLVKNSYAGTRIGEALDKLYRVKYAKSGRASCKKWSESLAKDPLRMAVMVQDDCPWMDV